MLNRFMEKLAPEGESKTFKDIFNEKIGLASFKVLSLLLTIILARILGPEGFGFYTVVISIALLLSTLFDLGIPTAILRYASSKGNGEEFYRILRYLVKIQAIADFIVFLILLIVSEKVASVFFKSTTRVKFVYISLLIAYSYIAYQSIRFLFVGYKDFRIVRNLSTLEGVFKLIFISILAYRFGVYGATLGFFIVFVALTISGIYYLKRYYPELIKGFRERIELSKKVKRRIVKYLFLLNLTTLSTSAYGWVDSIIISAMLDLKSVGFYRVANSIVSAALLLTGLQAIFAPRISLWSIDKIKQNLPKIIGLNLILGFIGMFLLLLLGKPIIVLVYGRQYLVTYELLKPLSLLLILNSLSYFRVIFNMKERPEFGSLMVIVMTIANAIADVILINSMGLIGAVWATVVGWVASLIFGYFLFRIVF